MHKAIIIDDERLARNELRKLLQEFPEVDHAEWFAPDEAKQKILAAQAALIDELLTILGIQS